MEMLRKKIELFKTKTYHMFDSLLDQLVQKIEEAESLPIKPHRFLMFIHENLPRTERGDIKPSMLDLFELAMKNRSYLDHVLHEASVASEFAEADDFYSYVAETLPKSLVDFFQVRELEDADEFPPFIVLYTVFFAAFSSFVFDSLTKSSDDEFETESPEALETALRELLEDKPLSDQDDEEEEEEEADEDEADDLPLLKEDEVGEGKKGFEIILRVYDSSILDTFKEVIGKPELSKREEEAIIELFISTIPALGAELMHFLKTRVTRLAKEYAQSRGRHRAEGSE